MFCGTILCNKQNVKWEEFAGRKPGRTKLKKRYVSKASKRDEG